MRLAFASTSSSTAPAALTLCAALGLTCAACGHPAGSGPDAGGGADASSTIDGAPVAVPDAGTCEPPDMLIVLDRTLSMHAQPDGKAPPDTTAGRRASKWGLAVAAVQTLTTKLDKTIRFGLELFPRNPGGGKCVTQHQLAAGTTATNPSCQPGELDVAPDIQTGAAITSSIDPDTTQLCVTTPIGGGITVATTELATIKAPMRDQYVVLLTDGEDTCDAAGALADVQKLAAAGVKTYVIGFGAAGTGVNPKQLDNFACAGHTAPGFPAPCTADAQGNYKATAPGTGAPLYLAAEDQAALDAALGALAGQVCCNCVQ